MADSNIRYKSSHLSRGNGAQPRSKYQLKLLKKEGGTYIPPDERPDAIPPKIRTPAVTHGVSSHWVGNKDTHKGVYVFGGSA